MSRQFLYTIIIGAIIAGTSLAGPGNPKIAADLSNSRPDQTIDVIIQYSEPVEQSHIRALQQRHGARHKQTFHFINSVVASLPVSELEALAADPSVSRITPDRAVQGTLDRATGVSNFIPLNQYLGSINSKQGGGVGIVYIDSGISSLYNFNTFESKTTSRIVDAESMIDNDPVDRYGHGTHVAGIGSGKDNQAMTVTNPTRMFWGVAEDSNIISLKVLNASGAGTDSSVIAGINRAIQLKSLYPQWNIRVINLSLGRPVYESYKLDPICQAAEKAWKAGIFVVVAAGNDGRDNSAKNNGYGTILAPGNDPLVMTVGAVNDRASFDRNSTVETSYSSKGPTAIDHIVKPDIVAPGNRISSYLAPGASLPTTYTSNVLLENSYDPSAPATPSPYYFTLSGTSMATPLVSGLAAIMFQIYPSLTPDQLKALIMRNAWRGLPASYTAVDPTTGAAYSETGDVFTVGAGLLDCWQTFQDAAAQNLGSLPKAIGAAASPFAYYDSVSRSVKLNLNSASASSVIWGSSVAWGTSVIWGTNVSSSSVISGSSVIWGTSVAWGASVIWGASSPWASSSIASGEASIVAVYGEN